MKTGLFPTVTKLIKRYLPARNLRCYALWSLVIVTGYVGMLLVFHNILDGSNSPSDGEQTPQYEEDLSESNIQKLIHSIGGTQDFISGLLRRGKNSSTFDAENCPESFSMAHVDSSDRTMELQRSPKFNVTGHRDEGIWNGRVSTRALLNLSKRHSDSGYLGCNKLYLNNLSTTTFIALGKHYIYSAYFDDRLQSGAVEPMVRIIALMRKRKLKTEVGPYVPPEHFFCHFRSDRGDDGSQTMDLNGSYVTVPVEMYEMCENHAKDFGGWIMSCRIPRELPVSPCIVFVTASETETSYNIRNSVSLPVFSIQSVANRRAGFAICVPPLFGNISVRTLIEFVELGRMLGAEHFVFYSRLPVVTSLRAYLAHYVSLGLATVVTWSVPVDDPRVWYNGQLLAINDCLYRTMHAFRFVAFNDLDEFIVPHRHSDWPAMITSFQQRYHTGTRHCGYSFRSAFFETLASSAPISARGPIGTGSDIVAYELESSLRTRSFSRVRTKVMVDPRSVFELGIHHISRLASSECRVVDVDPADGFVHHYRQCVRDFDAMMNCDRLCDDETLHGYIPTMRRRVRDTIDEIQAQIHETKRTRH